MAKSLKTSSMESLPQGREGWDPRSWGTRTCAGRIKKHLTSTSTPGRTWQWTTPAGEVHFTNICKLAKRSCQRQLQESGPEERGWQPTDQNQCTDAIYVIEIVPLGLYSQKTRCLSQADISGQWTDGCDIHAQSWPKDDDLQYMNVFIVFCYLLPSTTLPIKCACIPNFSHISPLHTLLLLSLLDFSIFFYLMYFPSLHTLPSLCKFYPYSTFEANEGQGTCFPQWELYIYLFNFLLRHARTTLFENQSIFDLFLLHNKVQSHINYDRS